MDTQDTTLITKDQKKYNFWMPALITGIVLWLPAFFFVSLGAGLISAGAGGPAENYQANGWTLTISALLGLPLAIICLVVAIHFRRKGDWYSGAQALRVPFYWLLLVIVIQIGLEFLSSVY